jgi:hypothetical protein
MRRIKEQATATADPCGMTTKKTEFVLHNDAKSEYAYGPATGFPDAHVVTFSESLLTEAKKNAWVVISMKNDWKAHFSVEQ